MLIARNSYDSGLNAQADIASMDPSEVTARHNATTVNQDHAPPLLGDSADHSDPRSPRCTG